MPYRFSIPGFRKDSKPKDLRITPGRPATTLEDCFRIALLLRRTSLPADVIPTILDHAECWAPVIASTSDVSQLVSPLNSGIVHNFTPVPKHIYPRSIRGIVFSTISHDQGWSWDKTNHGSYNSSWTWFETGVVCTATRSPQLQDCRRIITNVHASKVEKQHRVEHFFDDPDPYWDFLIRQLASGASIGINVCAMYPGWQNLVKQSTIAFVYQPIRKVP
jgi:hypothetical protein